MDFWRTAIRNRKYLNASDISVLLSKIINKHQKDLHFPPFIRRVIGLFKYLKYQMESAERVNFGKESNHFEDQESEIKKQRSNLNERGKKKSKRKINQKTLPPAFSKISSVAHERFP